MTTDEQIYGFALGTMSAKAARDQKIVVMMTPRSGCSPEEYERRLAIYQQAYDQITGKA